MHEIETHTEVTEWLIALSGKDWACTVHVLDTLQSKGPKIAMPLSKALGDGLFELRFTCEGVARRISYRFTHNGRIILLTTFRKQRQHERREVARARQVAAECAARYP